MAEKSEHKEDDIGLSGEALSLVAGHSAVAGLCPLIPLPFVDDAIIKRVHQRLYKKLCAQHDFYLAAKDAKFLTSRKSGGFLSGAVKSLVLWPIKKIVRKVIYVLAIKSCADVAAAMFHEGWLMARALEQDYVSKGALARGEQDEVRRLRDAIVKVRGEIDTDPTRRVMKSALGVGREVFGPIVESARGIFSSDSDDETRFGMAEETASPITERILSEVRNHWALGPTLDEALRRELQR